MKDPDDIGTSLNGLIEENNTPEDLLELQMLLAKCMKRVRAKLAGETALPRQLILQHIPQPLLRFLAGFGGAIRRLWSVGGAAALAGAGGGRRDGRIDWLPFVFQLLQNRIPDEIRTV